ncbi:hypothetical protein EV182_004745 [Spiromyces aspiralis]|uniref:Uncharacterized protein n=1 Tax=Spiromyces aspiralis TaxID=68401 RepID=A0ACC1HW50_9FUNG|nr:hypothetical protein EV182_004745 [Spiromyces aspiralis]
MPHDPPNWPTPLLSLKLPSVKASPTDHDHRRLFSAIRHILRQGSPTCDRGLTVWLSIPELSKTEFAAMPVKEQWLAVQHCLSKVYTAGTFEAKKLGRPYLPIDIIIEEMAGYTRKAFDLYGFFEYHGEAADDDWHTGLGPSVGESFDRDNSNTGSIAGCWFEHSALGGTFDHLHAGHKVLLTMAAYASRVQMTCGISGKYLRFYLIVSLSDKYGPTSTDPSIDALVVSLETLKGSHDLNDKRRANSLEPMELLVIDVIGGSDDGNGYKIFDADGTDDISTLKLSSTLIRQNLARSNQQSIS